MCFEQVIGIKSAISTPSHFQVSYVTLSTRETFSKVGRELLGAITAVHPEIISILLERVQDTIDQVGMVRALLLFTCLFLFPFKSWSNGAMGNVLRPLGMNESGTTGRREHLVTWALCHSHAYLGSASAYRKLGLFFLHLLKVTFLPSVTGFYFK